MIKIVNCADDLFVGWNAWINCNCWVYPGKSHKLFFGNHLYWFLVVVPGSDSRIEFLSSSGVLDYVLSALH